MRVMGIDPGLTRCGLGVVDVDASRRASLVYVGVARTDKDLATHFRLRTIADAIDSVIERYEPEVVAIERVFAQDNLQSVTTTMQVMGAAMTCVGRAGLVGGRFDLGSPDCSWIDDARSTGVGRGPGRATPNGCRRSEA